MTTWQDALMSRLDALLDGYPPTMTTSDVATVLGVTERTVVRWLKASQLPGIRLPRGWVVLREDFREYLRRAYNVTDDDTAQRLLPPLDTEPASEPDVPDEPRPPGD